MMKKLVERRFVCNMENTTCVYLGNLDADLQLKFLRLFDDAQKYGVSVEQFIAAWNFYAVSIDEHVFLTKEPTNS
jgi:hypothetical protein